jgi:hypothetical protein
MPSFPPGSEANGPPAALRGNAASVDMSISSEAGRTAGGIWLAVIIAQTAIAHRLLEGRAGRVVSDADTDPSGRA